MPKIRRTPSEDRTRLSIVVRLSAAFFLELVGIFLLLNFVLCTAGVVAAAGHAEQSIRLAAGLQTSDGLSDREKSVLQSVGVSTERGTPAPRGMRIPSLPGRLFFDRSLPGERYLIFPDSGSFLQRLSGTVYRASLLSDDRSSSGISGGLTVSVTMWNDAHRLWAVLLSVLAAELVLLFLGVHARTRRIRKTLRPIAELAETARKLNQAGPFTPEEIETLAGKINGINASRLDTRIAVSSTQAELKNLAAAINGMLDRISESYRAQVRFVSDASHELRTPIAVIQGYVSLLDRWGKNDEAALQESISAIKSETDNMKLLIEQLLFLARGDNHTMILQMERFDAAPLAERVFREAKMIDAGHEYRSHIEPVLLEADETLVKQALRILVDNAVKYTPAEGSIMISSVTEGEKVRLTVQDDGIGIPPEAVPHIFDRFFRTDESRARATGGAGLGLSIAKWIAERHGGYMEVISRERVGTRISLVLPAAGAEKEPETEAQ